MCGRVRRVTSIAEIKLAIGFPDSAALPNLPASWNVPPTSDLLVAVRGAKTGHRTPAVLLAMGLLFQLNFSNARVR